MDLPSFPDDWMVDILIHLSFIQQCRLRRVSRKWHKVLQSRYVLHNLVLHATDRFNWNRRPVLIATVTRTAPFVYNVIITTTNSTSDQQFNKEVNDSYSLLRWFRDQPGPSHRSLILHNVHIWASYFLGFWNSVFHTVEFRSVWFCGDAVIQSLRFSLSPAVRDGPLGHGLAVMQSAKLAVHIAAPSRVVCVVDPSATFPHFDFQSRDLHNPFRMLFLNQMKPLNQEETGIIANAIRRLSSDSNQANTREWLAVILAEFQPGSAVLPDQDLIKLDFNWFSPIVQRLLFSKLS